jgi:hypothetical protein
MLFNNTDLIVAQAEQHRQALLAAAEQHCLVQRALGNQSTLLGHTLTYVGELLVTSGEWLKAHGELPSAGRPVMTQ